MVVKKLSMPRFSGINKNPANFNYAKSGVDIRKGDLASKKLYEASKRTWSARKGGASITSDFDDFTGIRYIGTSNLNDVVVGSNSDGIGTKTEVAERLGKFDTLGFDLLAMVCDDAVVRGGEPVAVTNVLDVNAIDTKAIEQLALGLEKAAKSANVGVINGELAELGEKIGGYGSMRLNWSASCIWLANRGKLLKGNELRPKQSIIALREYGFRSNGFSLVHAVMRREFGDRWHEEELKLSTQILTPSSIYARFAASLFGGYFGEPIAHISAMANITGGGIPSKLGRALKPSGLGARLEYLFEPSMAMLEVKELGGIRDKDAYSTWNMGNGFMIITDEPEKVLAHAKRFKVEARIAGTVVKNKGIDIVHDSRVLHFA